MIIKCQPSRFTIVNELMSYCRSSKYLIVRCATVLILAFLSGCNSGSQGGSTPGDLAMTQQEVNDAFEAVGGGLPDAGQVALVPLADVNTPDLSVLFVGNSYMAHRPYVDGEQTDFTVARQFIDLIKVDNANVRSKVKSIGGGTLKQHWDAGNAAGSARAEIGSGNYQLLVIQGRYDILENSDKKQRFDDYADRFATLANASGMTVVFYGLWATDQQISSTGGDTFGPEAQRIYCTAAARNGASCAPNGLAYELVYKTLSQSMDDSSIEDLLTFDAVHPFPPVAYMAANVLYATVFGRKAPPLAVYRPPTTNDSIGNLMRDAAWTATTLTAVNGN